MDERRFDALTKSLVAAKPSRREALRRLAGGALATVFGGLAIEEASAQFQAAARTCGQRCNADDECNAGLQCGAASEECLAIPSSKDNCSGNGDCTRNYETCNNNGRCINTVGACDECFRSGDCEGTDTICSNGRCIVEECRENSDCSPRRRCRQGRCVRRD